MHFSIRLPHTDKVITEFFPCREETLQYICNTLGVSNSAHTAVIIEQSPDQYPMLQGHVFKLDELNLLAQIMKPYSAHETATFCAVAVGNKVGTAQDFINLSLNLKCYSVFTQFGNFETLGQDLFFHANPELNVEGLNGPNGAAYAKAIIANSSPPIITEYGLVYTNHHDPQIFYQGGVLPTFSQGFTPIELRLKHDGQEELLALPCLQSAIDKKLERLGTTMDGVDIELNALLMPLSVSKILVQECRLDRLNHFAGKIQNLGKYEFEPLSNLMDFTQIETSEELDVLLDCYHEFEMFPYIVNANAYGIYMICKSGRFDYDENLEDYIDFEAYGEQKIRNETGVFTPQGYLLYHGYHQRMEEILHNRLGLAIKNQAPMTQLKLYMPLKVVTYQQENDWGHMEETNEPETLSPMTICGYENQIQILLQLDNSLQERERGLMAYYNESASLTSKVRKLVFDVEEVGDTMMGVAICDVKAPLTERELLQLKDYITGQASDGLGESLEQRPIDVDGQEVFVSLWNSDGDWKLQTQEEVAPPSFTMQMGGM